MPRRHRVHAPGAFYHVTLRGNHRQRIFFRPEDRELLSGIVAETIMRYGARVHAYCWMTNHIHLLIQVGEVRLGRIMLRIASWYARTVQQRLETTGHLFERRHYPILVDADAYLLALLRYIHINPVEAKLVASAADYPWSSHHAYIGQRDEPWVTTDFALRMFHCERGPAVAAYLRFLQAPSAEQPLFHQLNENDSRILGSDDFMARLLGRVKQPRSRTKLDELIVHACEEFSVPLADLESSSRHRRVSRVRAWIAQQAVAQHIASVSEVARRLNRDESTVRYLLGYRTKLK